MSLEKAFFPIVSKLVVALFAFFATSSKILVNVMFFTPSLGLFDILGHWQAEQLPFAMISQLTDGTHTLNDKEGAKIPWNMIDRWVGKGTEFAEPPNYSLYTGISLGSYFIFFLAITVLQAVLIFIMKRANSSSFKSAGLTKQMVHALENTNIPTPFRDWDVKSGTEEDYRSRMKEVVKEVLITVGINKLIGFLMLVPLILTGDDRILKY